jgi:aspartyl-tRNA(Asn)/glutamyl-tRNA(Gln) amidotransferase subunit C
MNRTDIQHLATLSRLHLTEDELTTFATEADAILGYIDHIKGLALGEREPVLPPHVNALRDDAITHAPGTYTEAIVSAFPKREGRYALVKKILNTNNDAE